MYKKQGDTPARFECRIFGLGFTVRNSKQTIKINLKAVSLVNGKRLEPI